MIPFPEFGTVKYPLRPSALQKIVECESSVALDPAFWETVEDPEETGGEAAQTGNLVHSGAAEYHRRQGASEKERTEAGLSALEAAREQFPLGDAKRATKIFQWYASDKANLEANVVKVEEKVLFQLPCAPFDPTGQPIYIKGTLDQIREDEDGRWTLWDIKTGKNYYGEKALKHYELQQCAYLIAAEQTYQKEVHPGGLICTNGYEEKKHVFFHSWYERDAVESLLWPIAVHVAVVRMGRPLITSGDHCRWCVHKKPQNCRMFGKMEGLPL